jgi:putative inorganic carbon (hco3(-)) transporter
MHLPVDGQVAAMTSTRSVVNSAALPWRGATRGGHWIFIGGLAITVAIVAVMVPTILSGQVLPMLILALLPLGLLIVVRFPMLIVLLLLACSVFRMHEFLPSGGHRIPLVLAAAGLVGTSVQVWQKRGHINWPPQAQWFAITTALVICGVPLAHDWATLNAAKEFSKTLIAMIALIVVATRIEDVRNIVSMMLGAGVFCSTLIILNKFRGIGLVEGTRAVILPGSVSMLGDPNDASMYLLPILALACVLAKNSASALKRVSLLTVIICLTIAIVATKSRGALIGMVGVAGFLGWKWSRSKVLMVPIVTAIGFLLLVAMGISSRPGGWDSTDTYQLDESASDRLTAWKAALNMVAAHPLLGVGIGNFKEQFYFYTDVWIRKDIDAHSAWFQVMSEAGLVTLVSFIAMIVVTFMSLRRSEELKVLLLPQSLNLREFVARALSVMGLCIAVALPMELLNALLPYGGWRTIWILWLPALLVVAWIINCAFRSGNALPGQRIVSASRPGHEDLRVCAVGLQAALVGFCVAASFLTQGFGWMLYFLVAISVVIESALQQSYMKIECSENKVR